MKTSIKALKVKIKSLAAEARIIRVEERRALAGGEKYRDDELFLSLRRHRLDVVRVEARHSLLAYGFLRGVPYRAIEKKPKERTQANCWQEPDWKKVKAMVIRFGSVSGKAGGPTITKEYLNAWREGLLPAKA